MIQKFQKYRWVAVGKDGKIMTSSNGTNWEKACSITKNNLHVVAFIKDKLVAVGDNGTILTGRPVQ